VPFTDVIFDVSHVAMHKIAAFRTLCSSKLYGNCCEETHTVRLEGYTVVIIVISKAFKCL